MKLKLTREEGPMRVEVGRSRRTRPAAALALTVSLLGGALVVLFSGETMPPPAALTPLEPQPVQSQPVESPPAELPPAATTPAQSESLSALGSYGGLDAGAPPSRGVLPSGGSPLALPSAPSLPALALPSAPSLPALQLPQFPAAPTIDWQAALQPYIQSQINAAAANLAGSITGTAAGAGLNSAALAVGDLILYAAYSDNGQGMLSQLQSAAPALQSALPPTDFGELPDLSGLAPAFAAAAAQPPLGVPAPPAGPNLPTPEQVAAALAVPAIGLPVVAIPALPPPPPIGLPTIGLPSITRLFGLPF